MAIDIDFPLGGTKVPREFTATGSATAKPTVVLQNAAGMTVATGVVTFANGLWEAKFNLGMDIGGLTLVAQIPGVAGGASEPNIKVEGAAGGGTGTGTGTGSGTGTGDRKSTRLNSSHW